MIHKRIGYRAVALLTSLTLIIPGQVNAAFQLPRKSPQSMSSEALIMPVVFLLHPLIQSVAPSVHEQAASIFHRLNSLHPHEFFTVVIPAALVGLQNTSKSLRKKESPQLHLERLADAIRLHAFSASSHEALTADDYKKRTGIPDSPKVIRRALDHNVKRGLMEYGRAKGGRVLYRLTEKGIKKASIDFPVYFHKALSDLYQLGNQGQSPTHWVLRVPPVAAAALGIPFTDQNRAVINDFIQKVAVTLFDLPGSLREELVDLLIQDIRQESVRLEIIAKLDTFRFQLRELKKFLQTSRSDISPTVSEYLQMSLVRPLYYLKDTLLPLLTDLNDPLAYLMRHVHEWIGWHAMGILKDHSVRNPDVEGEQLWLQYVADLLTMGFDKAALTLGALVPGHMRQQSDRADQFVNIQIGVSAIEKLRAAIFAAELLGEHQEWTTTRELSALLFDVLHVHPGYGLARAYRLDRPGRLYSMSGYRRYVSVILDAANAAFALHPSPSEQNTAEEVIAWAVDRYPHLLAESDGSLSRYLRFAEKRNRAYKTGTGRELIRKFAEFWESQDGRKKWPYTRLQDLLFYPDHPLVHAFLLAYDHEIPKNQLRYLTAIRDGLLSGDLTRRTRKTGPFARKSARALPTIYRLTSAARKGLLSEDVVKGWQAQKNWASWKAYLGSIRALVNPNAQPLRLVYFFSGADISSALLATDADELHLYEQGLYLDPNDTTEPQEREMNLRTYSERKFGIPIGSIYPGFSTPIKEHKSLRSYLLLELFSIGVREIGERFLDSKTVELRFRWSPDGKSQRQRTLIFHSGVDLLTDELEILPADVWMEKGNNMVHDPNHNINSQPTPWFERRATYLKKVVAEGGWVLGSVHIDKRKTFLPQSARAAFSLVDLKNSPIRRHERGTILNDGQQYRVQWDLSPLKVYRRNSEEKLNAAARIKEQINKLTLKQSA